MSRILHDDRCTGTARLIPCPVDSFEASERFEHRDLPDLSHAQLWAEETLITAALATAIFERRRPTVIQRDATGLEMTDREWLRVRLIRLRGARRTRRAAA